MKRLRDNSDKAVHLYETAILIMGHSSSPISRVFAKEVKEYLEGVDEINDCKDLLKSFHRMDNKNIPTPLRHN